MNIATLPCQKVIAIIPEELKTSDVCKNIQPGEGKSQTNNVSQELEERIDRTYSLMCCADVTRGIPPNDTSFSKIS